MRRLVLTAALAAVTAAFAPPAAARAEPCPSLKDPQFRCSHLTVPLDRSGRVHGTVRLFVERRGRVRPGAGALLALAGGPGQAATQLDFDFAALLGRALANRQLVVFDERGTGRSGPLRCSPSLASGAVPPPGAVSSCAARLGARRAFYTSRDSADDIEAIRRSIGVERISLYGGSYGTYTALTYARRYPGHVESLILDSTVPSGGLDPLDRAGYAAVPRMLRDVCSGGACGAVTPDPVADLGRVVSEVARAPRLGSAFDGHGDPQLVRLTADAVHDLVFGADTHPFVAADLPSVMRAAAGGDLAPLARAIRENRATGGLDGPGPELDAGEYFARVCEEAPMPWPRTAAPSERRADLTAAVLGLGAGPFSPWPAQTETDRGTAAQCLDWPYASTESPVVDGPLPGVPTLILSGLEDIRTPLENAQEVASRLPGASVVSVSHAGHGVLETVCGQDALEAFEAGRAPAPCRPEPVEVTPGPPPPLSLRQVPPSGGLRGAAGRTLTAVNLTFADGFVHLAGGLLSGDLERLVHFGLGGLRGGYVRFDLSRRTRGGLVFHHFAYVPGVTITGVLGLNLGRHGATGRLVVGGSAAVHGVLRPTEEGVTGVLGHHRVRLSFGDLGTARSARGRRLRLPDQLREGDDAVRRAVERMAGAQHEAVLALHGVRYP